MGQVLNPIFCKVGTSVYNQMQHTVIPLLQGKIDKIFDRIVDKVKDPNGKIYNKMRTTFKQKIKEKMKEICEKLRQKRVINGGQYSVKKRSKENKHNTSAKLPRNWTGAGDSGAIGRNGTFAGRNEVSGREWKERKTSKNRRKLNNSL